MTNSQTLGSIRATGVRVSTRTPSGFAPYAELMSAMLDNCTSPRFNEALSLYRDVTHLEAVGLQRLLGSPVDGLSRQMQLRAAGGAMLSLLEQAHIDILNGVQSDARSLCEELGLLDDAAGASPQRTAVSQAVSQSLQ